MILRRVPRAARAGWKWAALALVLAAALGGWMGWRIYTQAQALRADVAELEQFAARPTLAGFSALGPLLARTRADALALRATAAPLLPITRRLGWLPVYGPDLAAAAPLLDLAADLAAAGDDAYAAVAPIAARLGHAQPIGELLAAQLSTARPHLESARVETAHAAATLDQLPIDQLSPALRAPLDRVRALLPAARAGLDLAVVLPELLGASGPRDYLLIAQNPDELRATGGLITAAGVLTLDGGRLVDFAIGDSGAVNDFAAGPYPDPPWPLTRYMGIELWAFQDANWSPDFPSAAQAAADLYALGQKRHVDGVLALDPTVVTALLAFTGPVAIADSPAPITSASALAYMRNSVFLSAQASAQERQLLWVRQRKAFMAPLAKAILSAIQSDSGRARWPALARTSLDLLRDRHIQIALRQPDAAAVLARLGWDGALRPGPADYLMVVDSNIGYNKATPSVSEAISYSVDLSDPRAPIAELIVRHTHRLRSAASCDQWLGLRGPPISRYEDMTVGCYWDYLRALVPGGSRMIAATANPTPGIWLLSGVGDDGTADMQPSENGTHTIGTLVVVPPGEQRRSFFRYRLPSAVLTSDAQGYHYRLKLQKQAGTAPLPVTLTIRLPSRAELVAASVPLAAQADQRQVYSFTLAGDQELELTFRVP